HRPERRRYPTQQDQPSASDAGVLRFLHGLPCIWRSGDSLPYSGWGVGVKWVPFSVYFLVTPRGCAPRTPRTLPPSREALRRDLAGAFGVGGRSFATVIKGFETSSQSLIVLRGPLLSWRGAGVASPRPLRAVEKSASCSKLARSPITNTSGRPAIV